MSQYLSPYSTPNVLPQQGAAHPFLKPARRASVLMFVLGPIIILMSGCLIGTSFLLPYMPADQLQQFRDRVGSITDIQVEFFLRALGGFLLVVGTFLLVLAFFVRRGGFVSTLLAIVLVGLLVLQQTFPLMKSFLSAASPAGLGNLIGNGFVFGLFVLLLVWLIGAARAIPKMRMAQQQYLMQYWQYQQNMQTFGGYPTQQPVPGVDQPQSETPISNQPSS